MHVVLQFDSILHQINNTSYSFSTYQLQSSRPIREGGEFKSEGKLGTVFYLFKAAPAAKPPCRVQWSLMKERDTNLFVK